jgi:hypothetical protein
MKNDSIKIETIKTTVDGNNVELIVRSPSVQDQREAQKVYNKAFTESIKGQCIVRAKLDDVLREQGLWDDSRQKQLNDLQNKILDGERKLTKGGIKLKEAKDIALSMKNVREDIRDLISVRTSLDSNTAEGQADNARFNYLVSACVVYKENESKGYFENLDDYLNRMDDPVALRGAQILANMIYGLDNDYEKNLPENKFLFKFKFIDDKLRLIDDKGRNIDREGRLVDESGRFINESGEYVDKDGNRVDIKGDYLIDHQPFLDDEGKPIAEDETPTEPVKKSRKSKEEATE